MGVAIVLLLKLDAIFEKDVDIIADGVVDTAELEVTETVFEDVEIAEDEMLPEFEAEFEVVSEVAETEVSSLLCCSGKPFGIAIVVLKKHSSKSAQRKFKGRVNIFGIYCKEKKLRSPRLFLRISRRLSQRLKECCCTCSDAMQSVTTSCVG